MSRRGLSATVLGASDFAGEVETGDVSDKEDQEAASEELEESFDRLSLGPKVCDPCKEDKHGNITGDWYCKQCQEFLCDECQTVHKRLKMTRGHDVDRLRTCDPCKEETKKEIQANWYCVDCTDFLCDECQSVHKRLRVSRKHEVISNHEAEKRLPIRGARREKSLSVQDSGKANTTAKPNIAKKRAKFVTQFDFRISTDKVKPDLKDFSFLPDGRLILIDHDNCKLKLFHSNLRFVQEKFVSYPWGVAVYGSCDVAVTWQCAIMFLVVKDGMQETTTIRTPFDGGRLSYISRDKLVVTDFLGKPASLYVITTDATVLSHITTDSTGSLVFDCPIYLTIDESKSIAYVLDNKSDSLCAITLKDNVVLFKKVFRRFSVPNGIALDGEGNIYICMWNSKKVVQLTPDGELVQTLVTEINLLGNPQTLAFTPGGDKLFVGFNKENILQVFEIETE